MSFLRHLLRAIIDHFRKVQHVECQIRRLGYESALNSLRNKIPHDIKTRSGDLGEILCTEYVIQKTDFCVPIKKLLGKDDRDRTMRGNDVLGFRTLNNVNQVLKCESKSRRNLSNSVVQEAEDGLLQHDGRPNPSTLAFLQDKLEDEERTDEADYLSNLQEQDFSFQNLRHLIFTFSGNAPYSYLASKQSPPENQPSRILIGVQIEDHENFINSIYEGCLNGSFPTNC